MRALVRELLLLLQRALNLGEISLPIGFLVGVKLSGELSAVHLLVQRLVEQTLLLQKSFGLSVGLVYGFA